MKKIRIAALGDSLTKGVILTDQNRYSIADCSFMDIISNELDTSVCNYGKFGCTVSFGNNVIDRHKDEITNSDYTFIEYGGNDCDFDWMKIADSPNEEHEAKTTLNSFKKQFASLISRVRELGSTPVIISLPPIIDITTPFDTYRGHLGTLYCRDGIHPNSAGHRLIAETIIKSL